MIIEDTTLEDGYRTYPVFLFVGHWRPQYSICRTLNAFGGLYRYMEKREGHYSLVHTHRLVLLACVRIDGKIQRTTAR